MIELLNKLIYLILRLFGKVENHTKPPELDGGAPDDVVKKLPPPEAEMSPEEAKKLDEKAFGGLLPDWGKAPAPAPEAPALGPTPWEITMEILDRPFKSLVTDIPVRRFPLRDADGKVLAPGVYSTYGRAPKETKNTNYPRAKLKVHNGLPGKWNKGKTRLYMEHRVGEHFREGLERAQEMEERISKYLGKQYDVVSYMYSIGAYSHRHIRHNPKNNLSYHSWAIAFDQNPGWNRGVTYYKKWQRRIKKDGRRVWVDCKPYQAQRGPINQVLPFSKQYYEIFPKSMPVELVMAFKSVHFAWGGDWGRSKWHKVVAKFGTHFDQNDPTVRNSDVFKAAIKEWQSMRYYDGMHFELTLRGSWAQTRFERMQKSL